jgi:hypothetical protein
MNSWSTSNQVIPAPEVKFGAVMPVAEVTFMKLSVPAGPEAQAVESVVAVMAMSVHP